jgi:hypothetical protein
MFGRKKMAILILISLIAGQKAYSQMQKDIPDYLKERFLTYTNNVPREEIFVHNDREEYIAGEVLWFKLYLIDRQSFNPSSNSRIAYFELLNSENRPVVQKRISLDKGFGPGQIRLPDSLSSGTYTIRAYTSWMKNFLPYNCFMKDIKIYNAFSKKAFMERVYQDTKLKTGPENTFIPIKTSDGLNLYVNNLNADTLEIILNTDNRFRTENNNVIYLFIQTHGSIDHVSSEKILSASTKISVARKELNPGINQITVFDSRGNPAGERYTYTPMKEEKPMILHSTDSCNKRVKVFLEIETDSGLSGEFSQSNMSISVAPQTNYRDIVDINDYMVFGSEFGLVYQNIIKGRKINELTYTEIDSNLLNIRSNWINWKTILSGAIPDFKYKMESEDHFITGKLLAGDQHTNHSEEFLFMCTPGKESEFQYARTDREGNFSFRINIDEELKDLIIMPNDVGQSHKIIIESPFSDQYIQSKQSVDSINKPAPPYISLWSVNYQVSTIYGVSAPGASVSQVFPHLKAMRFYGKPDIELIMADYISLPVMEEVFFELLPRVSLKKKKSVYEISIADRVDNSPYITSPCLLIDGVIIKDPSLIADLDPEIVEKIDVIKEKYLVGNFLFSGIVNVITKSGNFNCIPLPDYMIRLPYRVTDRITSFTYPDYSLADIRNNHIPDFRNTLYWNPSVRPDNNGKVKIEFWSSDVVSDYIIDIQGIGSDGKLISLRKNISIKK